LTTDSAGLNIVRWST